MSAPAALCLSSSSFSTWASAAWCSEKVFFESSVSDGSMYLSGVST